MNWWTIVWPVPAVRAVAWSQSLPTAKTHEPALVVVNATVGAPVAALAPALAPTPDAPLNASTVNDWSWVVGRTASVDVMVTFVSGPGAVAVQISEVPGRTF